MMPAAEQSAGPAVEAYARSAAAALAKSDPTLTALLHAEIERQQSMLSLVASASVAHPSVFAAQGLPTDNLTTEGLPGARYHAGARFADEIERLAVQRARDAFGAQAAFVQPHCGTSANYSVIMSLLRAGDTVLSLRLDAGGHISHGARTALPGRYLTIASYGVDSDGLLDYDEVAALADRVRPKLIVAGASAYPRAIDFRQFRVIADKVGAILLADISHIAGLVATGLHQSPIDLAHVTTTSTYKQLGGPRGGLILLGADATHPLRTGTALADHMRTAVFPFLQGTPSIAAIAAKARALELVCTPWFRTVTGRIVSGARALATGLAAAGYCLVTGGTDNHMVVVDLSDRGITGAVAQDALERCGIVTNKNLVPNDLMPPSVTSGIRLGTNTAAFRGMGPEAICRCVELVDEVLSATAAAGGGLPDPVRRRVRAQVSSLCEVFPLYSDCASPA
jgi:glycine hydroxymethyltransferase